MRVVCAPDSFKHSLSAAQAAAAMARGVREAHPDAEAVEVPLSDGGEGFTDAIADALGARIVEVGVLDALGRPATGRLALAGDLAAFEVATAVGLEMIADDERAIMAADTRGVGQLILAALDAGARRFVIGLGGSATNDGGAGMLSVLGVRFLDAAGEPVATTPSGLEGVVRVDASGLDARLAGAQVRVACDVDNPLLGVRGASAIFGPQKGATPDLVPHLDGILARLVEVTGTGAVAETPGAGAAGGLGWAMLAYLGAQLVPGIRLVCDTVGLAATVAGADLVLSGEGSIDSQTLFGQDARGRGRGGARPRRPGGAVRRACRPGRRRAAGPGRPGHRVHHPGGNAAGPGAGSGVRQPADGGRELPGLSAAHRCRCGGRRARER
ncbi:MAG: glycerate kinase [Propioniciclava sp.]